MMGANMMTRKKDGSSGFAVALLCWATLLSPATAFSAAAYLVGNEAIPSMKPLPLEGGEAQVPKRYRIFQGAIFEQADDYRTAAHLPLPFPVSFFGKSYDSVAVGHGILTFGSLEETICLAEFGTYPDRPACANLGRSPAGPIPRQHLFPNLLLAYWWSSADQWSAADRHCMEVVHQTLGEKPNRSFVVEVSCGRATTLGLPVVDQLIQIWFSEGSSTIEVRYDWKDEPVSDAVDVFAFVGVMSPAPGGGAVEGYPGLPCSEPGNSCRFSDFPAGRKLIYSIPADLVVETLTVAPYAEPGLPLKGKATIRNIGEQGAAGLKTKFFLSGRATFGSDAIELGETEGSYDLGAGELAEDEFALELPAGLKEGTYFLIAFADPYGVIEDEADTRNNFRSTPFAFGPRAPRLSVKRVSTAAEIAPDQQLQVSAAIENEGSGRVESLTYLVVLSTDERIGLSDRMLHFGELDLEAFRETQWSVEVTIPEDVPAGTYYVGIVIDPIASIPSFLKIADSGRSEPLVVGWKELEVLTKELPAAQLGQNYCVALEASGGVGSHSWTVSPGSNLPAGLRIEEYPEGAREAGVPFVTSLCGRPSRLGNNDFQLQVRSGESVATQAYELEVSRSPLALSITSTQLPVASYLAAYEGRLGVHGGEAPYGWKLIGGELPQGLQLRGDGVLVGTPVEDGRFTFEVQVKDAAAQVVSQELVLLVTSPSRLRCGARALPPLAIGEAHQSELSAAGGIRPYRWRSVETRRLPEGPGESVRSAADEAPPGFSLGTLGQVVGEPTEGGRFLWIVAVSDGAAIPAEDQCIIVVDVAHDRGLTVSTLGLRPAVVALPYTAALRASGGEGALEWRLMAGNRLPEGFTLSKGGTIEGVAHPEVLDGDEERAFPFMVEVRDIRNRKAVAALSILLRESQQPPPSIAKKVESSGGCSHHGVGPGVLALLLVMPMILRRRGKVHG